MHIRLLLINWSRLFISILEARGRLVYWWGLGPLNSTHRFLVWESRSFSQASSRCRCSLGCWVKRHSSKSRRSQMPCLLRLQDKAMWKASVAPSVCSFSFPPMLGASMWMVNMSVRLLKSSTTPTRHFLVPVGECWAKFQRLFLDSACPDIFQ